MLSATWRDLWMPITFGRYSQELSRNAKGAHCAATAPYALLSAFDAAGFCTLMKFDARVGGTVVCPAAARLLRIR
jgi:hypothetical protein